MIIHKLMMKGGCKMASPSKYRRDGRTAFIPGEEPNFRFYDSKHYCWCDFLDGWEEARKAHEAEEKAKEEAEENRDYRFNHIKEEIIHLQADPDLKSILLDMLELLEEKTDGTTTN